MARGTTLRNIRIPDELWEAAKAKAEADGTDVSALVRAYLIEITRHAPQAGR